jgi:DNA-binding response OmpR family regulator
MKPKLLIIDDDQAILNVLTRYFSPDFDTYVANGGISGIEMFKKHSPDAVL